MSEGGPVKKPRAPRTKAATTPNNRPLGAKGLANLATFTQDADSPDMRPLPRRPPPAAEDNGWSSDDDDELPVCLHFDLHFTLVSSARYMSH